MSERLLLHNIAHSRMETVRRGGEGAKKESDERSGKGSKNTDYREVGRLIRQADWLTDGMGRMDGGVDGPDVHGLSANERKKE